MTEPSQELLKQLASEVAQLENNQADLERNCWMVVHQHRHGMFPSEYDIREIDEDLYLALLCLLYTSPSPRDVEESRMPSSA